MGSFSRRAFLSLGTGTAAATWASLPLLSEGDLAARALGPVRDQERSRIALLHANENPYGPCELAREAIARFTPDAGRYPYDASKALLERLAKLHDVPTSMIVVGNGSSEVLRMATAAFLKPGKALVVPQLTYESPGRYAKVVGAEIKTVPLTADFRHDVKAMAAAAAAGSTGLIYVCNPNNPTATITPKAEIESLVAATPAGAVLLIDEAYHHFAESPQYEASLKYVLAGKDVVVSRTFSKIYGMAGMRIGYAVAKPELAERLRRHAQHLNTNLLGLEAALASLDDRDLVSRNKERILHSRRLVTDWLDRQHIRYAPTEANFIFFYTGKPVEGLIEAMRKREVVVGRPFPPMLDWMRVTVGTDDEMRKFLRAYQEIQG